MPPSQHPVSAWRLAALNLLLFAPVGVQLPFMSLWYASIGFGAEAIAFVQGATPVARFASNLLIPPIADRRGNAPLLLALCALGATAGFAFAGLHSGFWYVFACVVAGTFAQGPMIALGDSMVLREARRRAVAGERALDYGLVRGVGSAGVLRVADSLHAGKRLDGARPLHRLGDGGVDLAVGGRFGDVAGGRVAQVVAHREEQHHPGHDQRQRYPDECQYIQT